MAVESGTATNHVDLYNKLYTFLTSDADLVAANQQWERVDGIGTAPPFTASQSDSDRITGSVMLKGPGLAQADEIFVSMNLIEDTSVNRHMVYLMGHNGVLEASPTYDQHVNSSPRKGFVVWNQNMAYWFIASGRRFMGVVKLGTIYEVFYAGLYLPYATPEGNPYPLMIGGTTSQSVTAVGQETANYRHAAFVDPSADRSLTALTPAGVWASFENWDDRDNEYRSHNGGHRTFPYNAPASVRGRNSGGTPGVPPASSGSWTNLEEDFVRAQTPLLGGAYMLSPVTLAGHAVNDPGVYGVMDGINQVTGYDNVAENTIQEGGQDHLVIQNVYRTAPNHYFTMRMV